MKFSLLVLLVFLAFSANAGNYKYSVGASAQAVKYCWYGASEACFNYKLGVIRFELEHKSGVAFRFGKAINKPSDIQTTLTNQVFKINFSKYEEYEIIYKYNYNASITVYGGVGHYKHSLPIYSVNDTLVHYDEDNDTGFVFGILYNLSDRVSIDFMIKQTSAIGDAGGSCDQNCINNWTSKGSTIRQIGLGLMIRF
tara:strand:+ start:581 stop:1171 length:591 start_codon:yes stop_codon:yes gene_type:complete